MQNKTTLEQIFELSGIILMATGLILASVKSQGMPVPVNIAYVKGPLALIAVGTLVTWGGVGIVRYLRTGDARVSILPQLNSLLFALFVGAAIYLLRKLL